MLLARAGHRVLLDKATFPSDKLSTHYIQPSGVKCLEGWGLLDTVIATNTPPISSFAVYAGDTLLMQPPMDGLAYCPRRYLLDAILVDAAAAAGAELRTGFRVDEIVMEDERVTGIVGHGRDQRPLREAARFVIGAEGHDSLVAKAVNAPTYREREALTGGYYSYWSGVDLPGAEVYISDRGGVLAFPTNDGRACIAAGGARANFAAYRANIEEGFFARGALDGHRRRTRMPWGPGWALVGDAGYMKDPVTGFGIADAFRDAGLLAHALHIAFSHRPNAEEALARYQSQRDEAAIPVYEMTLQMASGEMAIPRAAAPA